MITEKDLLKDVNSSNRFRIPSTGTYVIQRSGKKWMVCKDFPTGKSSPANVLSQAQQWTLSTDIPNYLEHRYIFDTLQSALDAYNRWATPTLPQGTEVIDKNLTP